jgi:hypothetical protein
MDIRITITQSSHFPNEDRLALADRYDERGAYAIDRRDRDAYYAEADRIRREELR